MPGAYNYRRVPSMAPGVLPFRIQHSPVEARMIGPLLRWELLLGFRKSRFNHLRYLYVTCLVLQFAGFYYWFIGGRFEVPASTAPPVEPASHFVDWFLEAILLQQGLMLFLLAPGFVAGAIAGDKASGNLQVLLTTSLTSGAIVLGKFVGRVLHVLLLALAGLPLLCLMAGLADLDPILLGALVVYTLMLLLAVSAASLLASVWCRNTFDAVASVYAVMLLAGLLVLGLEDAGARVRIGMWTSPLLSWVPVPARWAEELFDPRTMLELVRSRHATAWPVSRGLLGATLTWGGLTVASLGLACLCLRPSCARQLGRASSRRPSSRSHRAIDDDAPVYWKQRNVEGLATVPWLGRVPRGLALLGFLVAVPCLTFWSIWPSGVSFEEMMECLRAGEFYTLSSRLGRNVLPDKVYALQLVVVVLVAGLGVGIRASGAITGERERHTWEMLLLTPLSSDELIRQKVIGLVHSARPFLVLYAVGALPLAWWVGQMEFVSTLMAVGLAWGVMHASAAVGIYYSAASPNSWKSMASTALVLIVQGFMLAFTSGAFLGCLLNVLGLAALFEMVFSIFPVLDWIGVHSKLQSAVSFFVPLTLLWIGIGRLAGREHLRKAQEWLDEERTPRRAVRTRSA
jgi:ABC-type transport system involved in multi-copper enzyme maturation permease subunit